MRNFVITIVALIVGFMFGLILAEVIGIVGVLGFGRAVGIKYLPIYTAISMVAFANLADLFLQRKSKRRDK